MRPFSFKLILLIGLFVALVVKGGQLCTAEGVQAMTRLVEPGYSEPADPPPLRPIEEEFRGVSPLPALADHALPSRRMVKSTSVSSHKPAKMSSFAKTAIKKPAQKS